MNNNQTGQAFYRRVKDLCNQKDIKITALARQLSLSPSAPQSWREGSLPKAETIIKIAEYFGVTTDHILGMAPADNLLGTAYNSAIVQGANGSTISIVNGTPAMDEDLAEIIKIFTNMDKRGRTAMLAKAYDLEERHQLKKG